MKVRVDRTSTSYSETKPVDCAETIMLNIYVPERLGDDKYILEPAHYIQINSLEDLLEFVSENGKIVIEPNDYKEYDNAEYMIEIYDSWRE